MFLLLSFYTCDQQSGQIAPEQTVILNVKLILKKLNQLRLKLEIDCKTKGYNPREKENNYITSLSLFYKWLLIIFIFNSHLSSTIIFLFL